MSRAERHREWEARVAEFRASGMGARKWCMEHGVKVKQLYYWLKKFREADPLPGAAAQWVLVTAEPEPRAAGLDVKVGDAVIHVGPGFDPALLVDVVRTLQAC